MAKRNATANSARKTSRKTSADSAVVDTNSVNPAPVSEPISEEQNMDQVNSAVDAASEQVSEPVAEGVTRFVKVGPANKNRATMYTITGRRGSIYVPNTMFPGFDAKAAESFVAPESFEVPNTPFVTAGAAKAAKPVSERKAKASANAAEKAAKLAERIAKAAERSKKDQERLAKLQAKAGVVAEPVAEEVPEPQLEEVGSV